MLKSEEFEREFVGRIYIEGNTHERIQMECSKQGWNLEIRFLSQSDS